MKKTLKYKWKPKVSLYKGIDNYIKWFLRKIKMIKLGFSFTSTKHG